MTFDDWIRQEADLIEADGCTFATGAWKQSCLRHDLEYYYAKDASDAYQNYRSGQLNYWHNARVIDKKEADTTFIRGIRRSSWLGFFDPIAGFRQLFRPVMGRAWNTHRKREKES